MPSILRHVAELTNVLTTLSNPNIQAFRSIATTCRDLEPPSSGCHWCSSLTPHCALPASLNAIATSAETFEQALLAVAPTRAVGVLYDAPAHALDGFSTAQPC